MQTLQTTDEIEYQNDECDKQGLALRLDTEDFKQALNILKQVAGSSSTLGILGAVTIEAHENGDIYAYSTDLDVTAYRQLRGNVDEPGILTIKSVGDLHEVMRKMNKRTDVIRLEAEGPPDSMYVQICGPRADFKRFAVHSGDFPDCVAPAKAQVPCNGIVERADKVLPFISTDDAQANLTGLFVAEDDDKLVATDGHKLRAVTMESIRMGPDDIVPRGKIIPRKALELTQSICNQKGDPDQAQWGVNQDSNNTTLSFGPYWSLVVRNIEESFPDFSMVLPELSEPQFVTNRQRWLDDINIVKTSVNTSTQNTRLTVTSTGVEMYASDPDKGETDLDIQVKMADAPDDDIQLGINTKYLQEALESIDSEFVEVQVIGQMKPVLFTPVDNKDRGDDLTVVMPMRI